MISCLILSAGLSSRFNAPKALVKINNMTLIEHLQTCMLETSVDEIIVVLGAHLEQLKPLIFNHKRIRFVYNKDWNFGQTSSFKTGLESISQESKAVLLLPIDYPNIKKETVKKLIQEAKKSAPLILIPTYQNKKGHPPIFSAQLKDEFLALDNSVGINVVAKRHEANTLLLPVADKGVIESFNTPEELRQIIK